jgi:CRP-like cAMP-binding protein
MSLESEVRQLGSVRPFDALPREALQLLAFSCPKRVLKSGQTLFSAGEPAETAYFVLDGEIVLRGGDTERRAATGVLIGESALLVDTIRPADATAATDSLLLTISSETFRRVLSEFPQGAADIRRAAARRAHGLIGRLELIRRRAFAVPSAPRT